ncbi:TIGR02147 family protein [Bdellovibrionota bacterium FG-1]
MQRTLFDFKDYRSYLKYVLPTGGHLRGSRIRLAEALGVQKGFISAVLHDKGEFSLEQAFRISRFLAHSEEEREFFLLLVQMARAGSKDLEGHFLNKINAMLVGRREIRERISTQATLSEADQLVYYSSWHYTAIHMCLMISGLRTPDGIARYLGLPTRAVSKILAFFVKTGLAEQRGTAYIAGPTRIHIASDSHFVSKHHTNWRMQAIQSMDRTQSEDLHYSLVMSISKGAAEKIREILLNSIQTTEPVIREAKDEGVYAMTIDLFSLNARE